MKLKNLELGGTAAALIKITNFCRRLVELVQNSTGSFVNFLVFVRVWRAGQNLRSKEVGKPLGIRPALAAGYPVFHAGEVAPGGEICAPPTTIAHSYNPRGDAEPGEKGDKPLAKRGIECITILPSDSGTSAGSLVKSKQRHLENASFSWFAASSELVKKIFGSVHSTVVEDLLWCQPSTTTWSSMTTSTAWRAKSRVVDSTYPSNFPKPGGSGGVRPRTGWPNGKGSPTPPPKEGESPWIDVYTNQINNNVSPNYFSLSGRYISRFPKLLFKGVNYGPRSVVG